MWLLSQGKKATFTLIPMWFMFITTIAALLYTSYNLLSKVVSGQAKGEALIGNGLMGLVALVSGGHGLLAAGRRHQGPAPL